MDRAHLGYQSRLGQWKELHGVQGIDLEDCGCKGV